MLSCGGKLIRITVPYPLLMVVGILLLNTLGGCSLPLYKESQLEEQAQLQFETMRASTPVSNDVVTNEYVTCVANAIIATLPPTYANREWDVVVFDSQSINAFAMPGGHIGVFTGILAVAENQDQLAAIIGHEVAHVTEHHALERTNREATTQLGVMGATLALGGGEGTADLLQKGAQLGLSLPYGRKQESGADAVGLMYMADAGFDPRQSVALWTNMEKKATAAPPEFMSTHPSPDSRKLDLIGHWATALPRYNAARAAGKRPNCRF